MINAVDLKKIFPDASTANCEKFTPHLNAACAEYGIDTPLRVAGFLAQVGHESGQLNYVRENLNYKAESLMKYWKKYFPTIALAAQYEKNPSKIGSRVYADRMGNGNEASGDGYSFRGRGLIQITGKTNYTLCGKGIGKDLIADPAYLETDEGAARSAGWFWHSRNINAAADAKDIVKMTRLVNGGKNGLEDREKLYKKALEVLT